MDKFSTSKKNSEYAGPHEVPYSSNLIDVVPSDSIIFEYYTDNQVIGRIELRNKTKTPKFYKIMTNRIANYQVMSSHGVIMSKESKIIMIRMKNHELLEKHFGDKFMVLALETNYNDLTEEELNKINTSEFWNEKNIHAAKQQKMILSLSLIYVDKEFGNCDHFASSFLKDNSNIKEKASAFGKCVKSENTSEIKKILYGSPEISVQAKDSKRLYPSSFYTLQTTEKSILNFLSPDYGLESTLKGGYQVKFEALKKKSNDQEIKISKLINERNDYLNQINKLKFIYESQIWKAEKWRFVPHDFSSVKSWQMLLIIVFFLILGSYLSYKYN